MEQGDIYCPYYITKQERDILEDSGLRTFIPASFEPPPISGRASKIIEIVVDFYSQFDYISGMGGAIKHKMDYDIILKAFKIYGIKKSKLNIKLLQIAEHTILKKGDSENGS